jgi:hypothetical protein
MESRAQKPRLMVSESLRDKLPELDDEAMAMAENVVSVVVVLANGVTFVGSLRGIEITDFDKKSDGTIAGRRITLEMCTRIDNVDDVLWDSAQARLQSLQVHTNNDVHEISGEYVVSSIPLSDVNIVDGMFVVGFVFTGVW